MVSIGAPFAHFVPDLITTSPAAAASAAGSGSGSSCAGFRGRPGSRNGARSGARIVRVVGSAYTAQPGNWAPASRPVRAVGGVYTGRRYDVMRREGAQDGDGRSSLTGAGRGWRGVPGAGRVPPSAPLFPQITAFLSPGRARCPVYLAGFWPDRRPPQQSLAGLRSGPASGPAASPIPLMQPGPPARPWLPISSPSHERTASARRCGSCWLPGPRQPWHAPPRSTRSRR